MPWILPSLTAIGLTLLVRARRIPGIIGVCLAGVIPFLTPATPQAIRLLVSAFAVVWAARTWERSRGREATLDHAWWAFWLWWLVPADARGAQNRDEAVQNRRRGWLRIGRASVKAGVVVGLVLINRAVTNLPEHLVMFTAWSMIYVYAFISCVADVVTGLVMLTGLHMSETFEAPLLARSSSEFWGRRWNRFVTRWAFRNVFIPTGGRRTPARSTLLVFVLSGLMHEYLIIACGDGLGDYTGWTLAFFVVQGLAVIAGSKVERKVPRLPAIALHTAFLLATAPLFFVPLDDAVGYSQWWKGDACRARHVRVDGPDRLTPGCTPSSSHAKNSSQPSLGRPSSKEISRTARLTATTGRRPRSLASRCLRC